MYCDSRSTPSMEMEEVGRCETVPEAGELLSKESRANVDKNVPSIAYRCRCWQWLVMYGVGGRDQKRSQQAFGKGSRKLRLG